MKKRSEKGRFTANSRGLGTVTEKMVLKRAAELAIINGREADNVLKSDLDQARRELTGEEGLVPTPTASEQIPEEDRELSPETPGERAPVLEASDEQTFAQELVEEGSQDAEHDQMLEATKDAKRRDAA